MLPSGHPHAWNLAHADEHITERWRRRYLVADSHLVITPKMTEIVAGIPSALDRGAIIAVSGPYGSGKSTLMVAITAVADVHVAAVDLSSRRQNDNWAEIASAVVGAPVDGLPRDLANLTRAHLMRTPTLLIVDEAQNMGNTALLELRKLVDQPYPKFALILAGSNLMARLGRLPAMRRRISRPYTLEALTTTAIVRAMAQFHPGVAATDPALIRRLDETYADGNWSRWYHLLAFVYNDISHTGPLNETIARDALRTIVSLEERDCTRTRLAWNL